MSLATRPDPTLPEHAEALHRALADLVRIYQFRDRDRICCHDVSVTQCYALEALVEHGPQRLGTLARALLLDKSTASRVVDALERKGYVAREADPQDGRALRLRVTRAGRALCERIQRELVAQQQALIADLEPAVREATTAVIRRLARAAAMRFGVGAAVIATEADACGESGSPACAGDRPAPGRRTRRAA